MTEEDLMLMHQHGITSEQKTVYHYRGYAYARLVDAVNYAVITEKRLAEAPAPAKAKP
jgi:hypothetical protein